MAQLNELYDENIWDLLFKIENKGDYLYEEDYGYESNNWAFDDEKDHVPAIVVLIKYEEKYYVYIEYMENDYYDVPEVFDELEPAYESDAI